MAHFEPVRRRRDIPGHQARRLRFFLNALIAFLILAAVVYFLVVLPYTKAKERFFPSPEPGTPEDVLLLQEIRDLLAAGNKAP